MTIQTQDVSKFKKLDEIDHVLLRPGRYLGSINRHTDNYTWFIDNGKVMYGSLTYVPAFLKLFDEIISNSADHSKRPEGKHLNKIDITASTLTGEISVYDNGGIPVQKHPEHDQWIPDMIFGELRSGSNFDDDPTSTTTGQNGEGSSLVNIFSQHFKVETGDGKKTFEMVYSGNMRNRSTPVIAVGSKGFTRISYLPDYDRLSMPNGLDDDAMRVIERRCWEIAATCPNLQVTFNGAVIPVHGFEQFVKMFGENPVYQETDNWKVGLLHSENGFSHISYVNTTLTYQGGTHVEYVMDKIIERIREKIEKKTKQKIKPSELKSQFRLFLDATINNPRYSSQTKENLITEVSNYGSRFEVSDKFTKAIMDSDIVKRIMLWAERKKMMEDMKAAQEATEKNRRSSFHHIEKYHPATIEDRSKATLFLAEGDSALKPLRAAKKPEHGVYPLRGKPINSFEVSIKQLLMSKSGEPTEFQQVVNILGLTLDGKVDEKALRYGSVCISTDADLDGIHIRGLMTVAFNRFWPELIEKGVLKFLKTPVVIAKQGRTFHEFFTNEEFQEWASKQKSPYTSKYFKGLGSHSTENMSRFMTDPKYMFTVEKMDANDTELLNMAFDPQRADDRKSWLKLH